MAIMKHTLKRIAVIKAIWRPGATAAMIAAEISEEDWQGKPSRNAIVGMFTRWANELAPCYLTGNPNKAYNVKSKSKKTAKAPTPEIAPKVAAKTAQRKIRKNSKNLRTGYIAAEKIKKPPRLVQAIRENYELTDAAIKKHLFEERMLARDRANIRSPSYRVGEHRQKNT